jgi:DNA processing protein
VAVVGTRNRSTYGRDATRKIVSDLVAAGVTIVSMLASQNLSSWCFRL